MKDIKDFIMNKCFEILDQQQIYEDLKKTVIESANKINESTFYIGYLKDKVVELDVAYKVLSAEKRTLSQMCHLLGDEYVKYMEKTLSEYKEWNRLGITNNYLYVVMPT